MGYWGGMDVMVAFSKLYSVNISVIQEDETETKIPDEKVATWKTLSIHYASSHYSSIVDPMPTEVPENSTQKVRNHRKAKKIIKRARIEALSASALRDLDTAMKKCHTHFD